MDYLMPIVFLGVGLFLGAFITNFFKSKKINALTQELENSQSKFYELQNSSKKKLAAKEHDIKDLQKQNSIIKSIPPVQIKTPASDAKEIKVLKGKNVSLENELKSLKTRIKELKVEKAVHKVDKQYPMQLYGMDDLSGGKSEVGSKMEKQKAVTNIIKPTEKNSKESPVVKLEPAVSKKDRNRKKEKDNSKSKSKKSKKKSKSKKEKSKKVLALIKSDKKGKKSKKKSKSKKKKNKPK